MSFLGLGAYGDRLLDAMLGDPREVDLDLEARSKLDSIKYRDLAVIAQLDALGADLRAPRHTMFYCAMPTEDAAQQCADDLQQAGLEVRVNPEPPQPQQELADANPWVVVAEVEDRAIIPDFLRETVDLCEKTAAAHGGMYDGWEASLTDAEAEDLAGGMPDN